MPGPHSGNDSLTPKQREAVRLEVLAMPAGEIAETVKVRPETVSKWRKDPKYIDAIEAIQREEDKRSFATMRRVRAKAIELMEQGIEEAAHCIREGVEYVGRDKEKQTRRLNVTELASLINAGNSAFDRLAGRSGLAETTRQEVSLAGGPAWMGDLADAVRDADPEAVDAALGDEPEAS